jgi:hypothetical protein
MTDKAISPLRQRMIEDMTIRKLAPKTQHDFERPEPCPPSVHHREIRPPIPRSKPTICAVTRGNIAELAATTFVALIIALLSVRTIEYTGEQRGSGEGVSQRPLKDKVFSTFPGQNPPFELRPKKGIGL